MKRPVHVWQMAFTIVLLSGLLLMLRQRDMAKLGGNATALQAEMTSSRRQLQTIENNTVEMARRVAGLEKNVSAFTVAVNEMAEFHKQQIRRMK